MPIYRITGRWSDHVVQLEGGKLQFRLQDDQPIETPSPLNDGEWHQVCTTVGEGGQRLHIDGKLIGTGKLTKRTKTSNRPGLDLGPGGGEGLIAMAEVRVFGRVLTDSEVAMLFTSRKTPIGLPPVSPIGLPPVSPSPRKRSPTSSAKNSRQLPTQIFESTPRPLPATATSSLCFAHRA